MTGMSRAALLTVLVLVAESPSLLATELSDSDPGRLMERAVPTAPPAGQFLVNVHRPKATWGEGRYVEIWDRRTFVGALGNGESVAYLARTAGLHAFFIRSGEPIRIVQATSLRSDETYDLWVDTKGGDPPTFVLKSVKRADNERALVNKWASEDVWVMRAPAATPYEQQHAPEIEPAWNEFQHAIWDPGGTGPSRVSDLARDDYRGALKPEPVSTPSDGVVLSPGDRVAIVLGVPVYAREIEPSSVELPKWAPEQIPFAHIQKLKPKIIDPLRRKFCRRHPCEPTHAETWRCYATMLHSQDPWVALAAGTKGPKVAHDELRDWKFYRALQGEFGGEVTLSEAGPFPVEAYRRWLEREEATGNFAIAVPALREEFYEAVLIRRQRVPPEEVPKVFAYPFACPPPGHAPYPGVPAS